jgi:predicted metal-dependent phosphoesterase TrpH
MANEVDLHIHTTASDGVLSPSQLVRLALQKGLKVIAITDHDSTEGLDEALEAARGTGLQVIPGIEVGTDIPRGEVHILGYFIDHHRVGLQDVLSTLRHSRLDRAKGMLQKLRDLGRPLEWERVAAIAGRGSVGRPHVAQAMLEKGYVTSLRDAFDRYLGRNRPAYVERFKLSPAEAVQLIRENQGIPVLAHPADIENLEALLPELLAAGLAGVEAFYNGYGAELVQSIVNLARKDGLIVTGGSDFHGLPTMSPTDLGGNFVPSKAARRLNEYKLKLEANRVAQERH